MPDEVQNEEQGLRERKKERTRASIVEAALDLFSERGFEAVPVSQVARRAEVSEATVFNYFATKEDLIYARLDDFWSHMIEAIERRDSDTTVVEAFREFLMQAGPPGSTPEKQRRLEQVTRIITNSPSLLAREREAYEHGTQALATLLARERRARPGDIRPRVQAYALMGLHHALVAYTREQVIAGVHGASLGRRIRAQAAKAFDLLQAGVPSG